MAPHSALNERSLLLLSHSIYFFVILDFPTTTPAPTTTTPGGVSQVIATHKGTFTVNVPVTAAMSTSGRLVVYYIRPDGEVVADGITFKVEECTDNPVSY